MNYFILQSALLIAVTYFLGAIVGCWLRKMFKKSASILHTQNDDLLAGAGVAATVGAGAAAARRLAAGEGEASVEISRAETRVEVEERTVVVPIPIPEPAPAPTPVIERETISYVEPEVVPEIVEEIVPDIHVEEVVEEPVVAPVPVPIPEPVVREPVAEPIIDDLTMIKGVGLPIALELKKIGITRFAQVARWTEADVDQISNELGFTGRIERENWMDQAKILASGDELEFTTHQLRDNERNSRSSRSEREHRARAPRVERAARAPREPRETTARTVSTIGRRGDNLKRVRGIDINLEQQLHRIGVSRISQIADWNDDEVEAISRQLGLGNAIEQQKWVEQAKRLSNRRS